MVIVVVVVVVARLQRQWLWYRYVGVKTHIWRGTWCGRGFWSRGCRRLGHRHEHRGVVVGSDSGGGSGDL